MKKISVAAIALTVPWLMGGCVIEFGDQPPTTAALDQVRAAITISGLASTGNATVTARLTNASGRLVQLTTGQAVYVGGALLSGPDGDGNYVATTTARNEYLIEVVEPSRGTQATTVAGPTGFLITAPAALGNVSLSGFTMAWDGVDPSLTVDMVLRQNVFGQTRLRELGPFSDTGGQTFSAENLAGFQQGASLLIEVTKSNSRNSVNGLAAATVDLDFTQSLLVTPGP